MMTAAVRSHRILREFSVNAQFHAYHGNGLPAGRETPQTDGIEWTDEEGNHMTQPHIPPQAPQPQYAPQQYPTGAQPQYAPQPQQQYSQQYVQQPQYAPQPGAPVQPQASSPIAKYIKDNPIFLGMVIAAGVYALLELVGFIMSVSGSYLPMALSGIETAAQYAMLNLAITFIGLLVFAFAPQIKATFFKMSLIAQCVGYGLWVVEWLMQLANSGSSYSYAASGYYTVLSLLGFGMVIALILNLVFLLLQLGKLRSEPVVNGTIK